MTFSLTLISSFIAKQISILKRHQLNLLHDFRNHTKRNSYHLEKNTLIFFLANVVNFNWSKSKQFKSRKKKNWNITKYDLETLNFIFIRRIMRIIKVILQKIWDQRKRKTRHLPARIVHIFTQKWNWCENSSGFALFLMQIIKLLNEM